MKVLNLFAFAAVLAMLFSVPIMAAAVPPQVTYIQFNRPWRTVSGIEPSGIGVREVIINFSKPVWIYPRCFSANDSVTIERVAFPNGIEVILGGIQTNNVTIQGNMMKITFDTASVVDTWVKITLNSSLIRGYDNASLDGETAGGSGRSYIYNLSDMPSGNGLEGGNAVFYVGSLRGDMRGVGFTGLLPDGVVNVWDINGFTSKYNAGNLDADMRGVGFTGLLPDGVVNVWDINGFTGYYNSAQANGLHLDPLPN